MGANCCVAARHKRLPQRTGTQFSTQRNVRYSPSWSLQWDNRTHAEDIAAGNPARLSNGNNRNVGSEIKSIMDTEAEGLSDGGSALDSSETPKWHKFPVYRGISGPAKGSEEDLFISSNSSSEGMELMEPTTVRLRNRKASSSMISPSSAFRGETSTSRSHSLPSDPSSSRNARSSPGYQLSRQISDSRIPTCKSLNEKNSAEGSQSLVLSACGNDLPAGGSHGESSDGWSMRMFSELVASSQRERWSFDSENTVSSYGKITRSSSHPLFPPSPADLHTCGICAKALKERSSWSSQKIVSDNEFSIVAVLVCGHVYHAECLESVTTNTDRYDPSCPVCISGEKSALKMPGKGKAEMKVRNKISRNAVADIDLDGISITERRKSQEAKVPKLGSSYSFKSFGRPFLRRHFSIGSRPTRPVLENEQTRKKGFWGRYRKE